MRSSSKPLTVLGIIFALIGSFSLFGAAVHLTLTQSVPLAMVAYAALDLLIAYAFLCRQRWLVWALAANWVMFVGIVSLSAVHAASWAGLAVGFIVNTIVLFAGIYYRHLLNRQYWPAGAAFFVVWILIVGNTIYNLL